ncbi:unnamed protein product [Cylicocyclus nassatus]|uniref:Uncharacterized protein n=1 Tax=Cylicocyclus nassatus TaxID=53992 RepID=A0AA36MAJ3_CYLNA|nr:unnamed protein product [Cylicocyclus nassatus]
MFRSVVRNLIFYRLFYFVFDIVTALTPISMPLLLFFCNRKLKTSFKRQYSVLRKKKNSAVQAVSNLIGLDGNKLHVDSREEANVYFQQLQNAWK